MSQANEHLIAPERRDAYNDPLKWGDMGIWQRPADVDVAKFQQRIDKIIGTVDGQPIIRLTWAWDARDWVNSEWDSFGVATKGEWRARYCFLTVKYGGDSTDLSIPRWVLEERFEPGQIEASWNASRYAFDPELGCEKDVTGPLPREGVYKMILNVGMVCTHDANQACCERLYNMGRKICWGYYKTPGEKELKMIARGAAALNADAHRPDPRKPFPAEVAAAIQASALERVEVEAQDRRDQLVQRFASLNAPSMVRGQQLYDIGASYTRKESSGLYVPANQ